MELVIDANVVISALISFAGKTRETIFSSGLKIFAPEFLVEEIKKHEAEILEKSGLLKEDFELALFLIFSLIEFIPLEEFMELIPFIENISPDRNDNEYLALALQKKCPIWSNDKLLKKQNSVEVISTEELLKVIGK